MRWQRNRSQTKEEDKTMEEKLSEAEIGNLPEKEFRSNDSKHDPRSQEMNGAQTEDTRNV